MSEPAYGERHPTVYSFNWKGGWWQKVWTGCRWRITKDRKVIK